MRPMWRILIVTVLLAALTVAQPASPAVAAGVVGDGDPGSCTETALNDALAGGGLVSFNCGALPHTIPLTGQKIIAANTQIDGGGLITLDGQDTTRIFVVHVGSTLALSNITLSNGQADDDGGAIYNNGTLTLTSSTLRDSSATAEFAQGGGIFNDTTATLTLTNSTLSGNTTTYGGGIFNAGTLTLTNSTLTGNSATYGGSIYNDNTGTLTLTNSTLNGNSGRFRGGGIYNDNSGVVTITDSTLSGNSAPSGNGGGIANEYGTLTLTNSILNGNSAVSGGGIYIFDVSTLTLTNSTLTGNSATVYGGGVFNEHGRATLTNSTLSGNSATIGGGAIANFVGTTTLTNSTLSGNSATGAGGGIYSFGTVRLAATIIAYSPEGGNCAQIPVTSQGGNISDDHTCNLNATGDRNNTDPLLGPLQDNGGPTETHLPDADSPAIDAIDPANCPTATDQRGFSRPQRAACDSGSVEVRPGVTYVLCANYYTGAVTSPLSGGCGSGHVELTVPGHLDFCVNGWTGQLTYLFGRPCAPPRWTHTLPDDGDLLTCVSLYTGANRWVTSHSKCTAYEVANTIPATP